MTTMTTNRREYALETFLTLAGPWQVWSTPGRVLCSDGIVRAVKRVAMTSDTWFSLPASVTVRGKTVSGYISVETLQGFETVTPDDPAVMKFIAYQYGKNADALPRGAYSTPLPNDETDH